MEENKKKYKTWFNIGRVKYLVDYHDGVKTHKDGSPFYDIRTFKNRRKMDSFVKQLVRQGFVPV